MNVTNYILAWAVVSRAGIFAYLRVKLNFLNQSRIFKFHYKKNLPARSANKRHSPRQTPTSPISSFFQGWISPTCENTSLRKLKWTRGLEAISLPLVPVRKMYGVRQYKDLFFVQNPKSWDMGHRWRHAWTVHMSNPRHVEEINNDLFRYMAQPVQKAWMENRKKPRRGWILQETKFAVLVARFFLALRAQRMHEVERTYPSPCQKVNELAVIPARIEGTKESCHY